MIDSASLHLEEIAVIDEEGAYSYAQLLEGSAGVAAALLDGSNDLQEARVCHLTGRTFEYPVVQWGIWRAGGISVPLAESHPPRELAYVLDDAEPEAVVVGEGYSDRLAPLAEERGIRVLRVSDVARTPPAQASPTLHSARRAMIVYTSGTTGHPKGVVTTHGNVNAQIGSLVEAWEWSTEDHILLVLPLHHVHGIINVLGCALSSGATCQMMDTFDAIQTWERFAKSELSLFMAVPTVYAKLISSWEDADEPTQARWSDGARSLRLMVSGSAALPIRTLERWRSITGHTLLERYGMTEIGMGLSNPLHGERIPGHVGQPLPGISVRRVNADHELVTEDAEPGELQIRGSGVFHEYWRRPEATATAFQYGWFRTGDIGVIDEGHYRLLGRSSVDILKCGGYKVSALEIEEVLREHTGVRDCAVVGLPDEDWGQRIAAAVVQAEGGVAEGLDEEGLAAHARECLAPYKVPREWRFVTELPRNAMGKVVKPMVIGLFAEETGDGT